MHLHGDGGLEIGVLLLVAVGSVLHFPGGRHEDAHEGQAQQFAALLLVRTRTRVHGARPWEITRDREDPATLYPSTPELRAVQARSSDSGETVPR